MWPQLQFSTFRERFLVCIDDTATMMNWGRYVCFGVRKTDENRETRRAAVLCPDIRPPELQNMNHCTVMINDSVVKEINKNKH
jgi:hypothetical protein